MIYRIGTKEISAEELADMKRTDLDCKFWIKRIQKARKLAWEKSKYRGEGASTVAKLTLESELEAVGVQILKKEKQ